MKKQYWIKYLGATNTKGERVQIKVCYEKQFNSELFLGYKPTYDDYGKFIDKYEIPYDYRYNNIYEVAREHLRTFGIIVDERNSGWIDSKKQYVINIK